MTRTKRGYPARRHRTKSGSFVSSFRGAHSRLTRTIAEQEIRALFSAHRDRDKQKINFRRLWITRINAAIRERVRYYNYSKFIRDLYKRQLLFNRKILAQITIASRNCLYLISNEIRIEYIKKFINIAIFVNKAIFANKVARIISYIQGKWELL
uniref:Large ribosomal subunit protein bL20c n=2 Tax=Adenocalymma TaxID=353917 RepID=A0A2H4RFZ3_9LAMI|nr:ribosomal protein L20 [Adenocalymma peregrinum]ATY48434.1 ribosomal protein L20 [Adenocalymma peregrinum]